MNFAKCKQKVSYKLWITFCSFYIYVVYDICFVVCAGIPKRGEEYVTKQLPYKIMEVNDKKQNCIAFEGSRFNICVTKS